MGLIWASFNPGLIYCYTYTTSMWGFKKALKVIIFKQSHRIAKWIELLEVQRVQNAESLFFAIKAHRWRRDLGISLFSSSQRETAGSLEFRNPICRQLQNESESRLSRELIANCAKNPLQTCSLGRNKSLIPVSCTTSSTHSVARAAF